MPNYFPIHITIIIKKFNFQNTTTFKKKKKKLRILRTSLNSRKAGLPCNHSSAAKFVRPNARTRGSTIPTSLCTHVCGRIPSARVHNARGDPAEKYIFAVRRAEMYSPNYLRIGVPNFPPLLLLSPTTRLTRKPLCTRKNDRSVLLLLFSLTLSLSSRPPPFPMVDSTFAWNAFI